MAERRSRRWHARSLLAGVVAISLIGLVLWPLAELAVVAGEQSAIGGLLRQSGSEVLNTLLVGASVTLMSVVFGLIGAIITERIAVYGRTWLRIGLVLPVLIPPFVSALSWLRAYGPSGLIDDMFGVSMPGIFGPVGVVVVVAVNAMPIAYVILVAALRSRSGIDLELAARVSGAGPFTVARTITIPLLGPALVAAGALVFVIGINAFGVPAILGTPASFDTVTTRIYQDLARSARPESFGRAILLATTLVIAASVLVLVAELASARSNRVETVESVTGSGGLNVRQRWIPTIVAWVFVSSTTILPLVALILVAVTRGVGISPTPSNWTLANFAEAFDDRLMAALGRSVGLAVLTATVTLLLGGAVVALRGRVFERVAGFGVLLGFAIPGSTLAVAMILAYGSLFRDTLGLILIAYVAKLWAIGHRSIAGSVGNLSPDVLRAARSSGATGARTVTTVVLPMLRPAMAAGWFLVFLIGFHELTMSSLLYGPGSETLAVAILNLQQLGDVPVSSALAVIITLPPVLIIVGLTVAGKLPTRLVTPS